MKNINSLYDKIYEIQDRMIEKGFEHRTGQEELIFDVLEAFEDNQNLIVEAGVGIGKSLGYLIPGLLIAIKTRKPLIVSSSTIQLTEQLKSDVNLAASIIGCQVETVVGKGLNNYPCIKKVSEDINLLEEERTFLINEIKKGVNKQNPGKIDLEYWNLVQTEKCSFSSCVYRHNCEYYKVRNELVENKVYSLFDEFIPTVLIINQDLLLADLQNKSKNSNPIINSDPCMIVIDEVHNLEEKQRAIMTKKFNLSRITQNMNDLLNILSNRFDKEKMKSYKDSINSLNEKITKYKKELHLKFSEVNFVSDNIREIVPRYLFDSNILEILIDIIETYELYNIMNFDFKFAKFSERKMEQLNIFTEFLKLLIFQNDNIIYWCQYNNKTLILYYCLDNQSKFLQENLFNNKNKFPIVCVSATIRIPEQKLDGYEYIMDSIGLKKYGLYENAKENEFDYLNSALFIPNNLPDHNLKDENYYFQISNRIIQISGKNEGGTLVLFTSKLDILKIYEILINSKKITKEIYLDDGSISQKEIIEKFKKSKGIILGTGVFWEGIDLKGDYLTALIIVQLPFPVPDPIIQNKISKLGDVDKVVLPEMLMKLKQGIGRLIRTSEDIGVLSILDNRLNNKNYRFLGEIYSVIPLKKKLMRKNWLIFKRK